MAHVVVANFVKASNTNKFESVWKLTRAMKAAGWRYMASADGTSKDTSASPASDLWGGGVATGNAGILASITTVSGNPKRAVITGLTGIGGASAGNFITISGAASAGNNGTFLVTKVNSATSVTIENNNAVASDANNPLIVWTEKSALTDTQPGTITVSSGSGAWWLGRGPSTLYVPIGAANPSPVFIRGENVTQAATGATGECLGVVVDTVTSLGFMVISPRVGGTGGGVRGWDTSAITGGYSTASVTPTASIRDYVCEIVFWKNTEALGHIYYQRVDVTNESTATSANGLFSVLAAQAQCTATVCPGGASGAPTVNGFPATGTLVNCGTGGSGARTTGSLDWFGVGGHTMSAGKTQIMVANAIEDTGISADGSFILAFGQSAGGGGAGNGYAGIAFQRCDDGEPGDLDPYVYWLPQNQAASALSTLSRTVVTGSAFGGVGTDKFRANNGAGEVGFAPWRGWRCRGLATGDAFQGFQPHVLTLPQSFNILATTTTSTDTVACNIATVRVREPIWMISAQQKDQRMRKGTLRWLQMTMVGSNLIDDTFDSKQWVLLSQADGTTDMVTMGGPWDGSSTPAHV